MHKTTVYLPRELDLRLAAEARAEGVSKAALIRRGVTELLEQSSRPRRTAELPVFNGGRTRSMDEIDDALGAQLAERAARR
ncbi:MAG: CopG family transcriptional regulator [Microbacterium sp.]|nr:MAG: CopG family transcriptional regulator [Microbacterium sp.]